MPFEPRETILLAISSVVEVAIAPKVNRSSFVLCLTGVGLPERSGRPTGPPHLDLFDADVFWIIGH
jgi:hypothetical protein